MSLTVADETISVNEVVVVGVLAKTDVLFDIVVCVGVTADVEVCVGVDVKLSEKMID